MARALNSRDTILIQGGGPTAHPVYSGNCGSFRWSVKTGTDNDAGKVNMVPQQTTVAALTALPTVQGGYCNRSAAELQTYELRDLDLRFKAEESDGDYHLIATDPKSGQTMVAEVPYPGCVGHDSCQASQPWLCAVTHARAAVDAKNPSAQYADLGTATIVGVGFFDTDELAHNPRPSGFAPNGVELHPVLAVCFGAGCDPTAGYP